MKVIFAVDAIFPPLTGIGRYAWELARRMRNRSDIEDIRFFSMGRWVRPPDDEIGPSCGTARIEAASGRKVSGSLRRHLAKRVWAVRGYNAVVPRWMQHRLRPFGSYVYHSPNFFVPPFAGQSVATIHDLSNYKYPETHPRARRKLFDLQMRRTLDNVDHLITDSEATRKEVIDFFSWPDHKITAIHLGVDPVFRPRPKEFVEPVLASYGLTPGRYTLCVSTLEPRKRIQSLLAAYEMLPPELKDAYPLVFAGDRGWLNESIDVRIERGQRAGWIRRLGFVSESDLPSIYAGAAAFCYPSIYEGFGLPVLEAMASGVPVLTSDRSSLPEVADGAALLIDPDDVDAMSTGIRKILEDATWRSHAIERGLIVAAESTWDRCLAKTMNVYRQIT